MASVEVRNGYKYYGSSSSPKIVLNYLNMNVEQGSIYGLLGASGCGKTTLLSCIVGQRQLNSGDVRVLGMKPGLPGSGIPGPLVGYMPQEIALVEEMTVKETIYYFGRVYDMDYEKIYERYNLLKNLLELPPATRFVSECSGGQKRRVSFACALIHEPELLILDEPTVGLDPMLREKIWDFLLERTRNSKLSVIITTHYIEEANQANRIGLMRNGVLLAEDTPNNIVNNLECSSLEEAFLKLSERQGIEDMIQKITQSPSAVMSHIDGVQETQIQSVNGKNNKQKSFTSRIRMKALLTKSVIQFSRQPSSVIFTFFFPIFVLTLYFLAVGLTPKNLRVGIVNDEVMNFNKCFDNSLITILNQNNDTCEFNKISCRYINELNSDFAEKVFFKSAEEAYESAARTDIIGYIHFPQNFSKAMQVLIEDGRNVDDIIINSMQMTVRLDMGDQQLAYFLQRRLLETFQTFMEGIMVGCNISQRLGRTPVHFEEVLYGSFDDEFQKFVTPGVIMTMTFFLSTIMTSGVFITEKTDGIWDRSLIAGISTSEMLMAHIGFQTILMIFQSMEALVFSHYAFGVENQGENLTIILLLILNGLCGMIFGLLISVFCPNYLLAMIVTTGAFYPIILLSGFLWPIEGMHTLFRKLVLIFPSTIPAQSARYILYKGWSIDNFQVYNGFLILIGWTIVFFILCIIGLRRRT